MNENKIENSELIKHETEYVWVTFDPLYEEIICVHKKINSECDKCKSIRKKRNVIQSFKFKLKS